MATMTIRAADAASALDEVLRLLGPDALIVSTRQSGGLVEITAAPPGSPAVAPAPAPAADGQPPRQPAPATAPGSGFAARLRARMEPMPGALAVPPLPPRLILTGPPGSGTSLLAARLAAAARMARTGPQPRLIAPRTDALTPPGLLEGWARLMGLRPDRPVCPEGLAGVLPDPRPDEGQIVDLSGLPGTGPDDLRLAAAIADAQVWLVLPTGLHPSWQDRLCETWAGTADAIALTRADLCPPTDDDLALPARHGLPLALVAAGTGVLDALSAPPRPAAPANPSDQSTEFRPNAAPRLS